MNCQSLNEIEGLQFIPVKATKAPVFNNWQNEVKKHDLTNIINVGLVCGSPSGNLECLDIDTKYSLDPKLFEKYKKLVHAADDTLLNKLVVQKTRSGGYHLIYRCSKIGGNVKLANRYTTDEEKSETYKRTYDKELLDSKTEDVAKKIAEKSAKNDKVRVLFETRGIGGQFVCSPSEGYEFIYGDLCSISEITPEQRDIILGCAMQFNEVINQIEVPKPSYQNKIKGKSAFEDYNDRGDVVALLESNGWKVVSQKGRKTIFLRPGQTTAQSSGNYDHEKKWFSVFTTSSDFEPQHAYLPYAVYAVLECNKDFSEASRKLYESGYGDREEQPVVQKEKEKAPSTRQIPSRINSEDEDYSFLAKPEDYDDYLQQVIDGTLPMGLTTGCPSLDEYFLYKEGNFVIVNGIDNTGKSVFMWWLLLIAAMYHGWKGIIFSSENTLGSFMRKMIQFYWGKQLRGSYPMSPTEYKIAKDFIESHFTLIKSQEDLYNYKDIINMVKKTMKKDKYNYGLIDPYNSLKIDLSGYSKLNTHEYHYEAASELKAFGQKNKFGWFINMHAVTSAARAKDGEKKYPVAPNKADTEGGQKFANKADDFATVHRVTGHPTDWMVTEFHIRKIKETDTGGRVTPVDNPVKFEMYKGGCGFIERLEFGGTPVDPIDAWHRKNQPSQSEMPLTAPEIYTPQKPSVGTWLPYKEDLDI